MDDITNSKDMSLSRLWEIVKDGKPGMLQFMGSQRFRHDLATDQQQLPPDSLEESPEPQMRTVALADTLVLA